MIFPGFVSWSLRCEFPRPSKAVQITPSLSKASGRGEGIERNESLFAHLRMCSRLGRSHVPLSRESRVGEFRDDITRGFAPGYKYVAPTEL